MAEADRRSMPGGVNGPIRIQAQLLRQYRLADRARSIGALAMTGGDEPSPGSEPSGEPNWRQRDLKRAIQTAQEAGLEGYRVEIAPDGTISIVVGLLPEGGESDDPYDGLLKP